MKNWQILPQAPKEFIAKFPEFDPLTLQLLYNRGIKTQKEVDEFFNPDYEGDLFDPFLLKDMQKACDRIEQAVLKKERVAVYGDYDADGVTSSVLLTDFLKNVLGLSGQVYIPDRSTEGYGLNKKAIDWLIGKKIRLVVTCDCGVSNKSEIDYGKSRGLDFIVLDHHHLHQEFSNDYIVINPKRKGDNYPFKDLAACGVVFKFIQGVLRAKKLLSNSPFYKGRGLEVFEKWLLDLVTIGTVADCVPLISENRTLVQYGMRVLAKTKRIGLQKLMQKASIHLDHLSIYDLSFLIAPRINAAGRIDHATIAYKLLATKDAKEAEKLSENLEQANYRRQRLCEDVVLEAENQIGEVTPNKKILFAVHVGWPLGIVGLVAGKLCEKFSRPVFILSKGENETSGSARSTPQFNIIEAIEKCEDLLLEYGGHKQAAGITCENKNLNKFIVQMEKFAKEKIKDKNLVPTIKVDVKIDLNKIDWNFFEELQKFEPSGIGNVKPLFITSAKVIDIQLVGSNKQHLKLFLGLPETDNSSKIYEAIGFNQTAGIFKRIQKGDLIDLVFELGANIWNGQRKLELKVLDFKKCDNNILMHTNYTNRAERDTNKLSK